MREQKVQATYNKNAQLYNKAVGGESWWSRIFQRMVWGINLADKALEQSVLGCIPDDFDGKLLDVPVGTGLFTKDKYAAMKAADITCLDYSQGMIDRAKEAYAATGAEVTFVQGDVANLTFVDGTFDIVLTMNGLPCFPNKEKSIEEILRVLKPGGDLVGCSFVKGERILSNFVIGVIYTKIGYTTPPYQTADELTALLKPHFDTVRTWKMGALLGFECKGKRSLQLEVAEYETTLADIESFVLRSDGGGELVLTRPDTTSLAERKYREIAVRGASVLAQVTSGAMPNLAHAQTLNAIAKAAPNGLFTATAPISELMKYADGTVGSVVMSNGKIASHSGFAEVALQAANPAAVVGAGMQSMAAISGQYYMHQISAQLKAVDRKLDKLIGYHHDEKIGILRSVNRELLEIVTKMNVDEADITACRDIARQCDLVFQEYFERLERTDGTAAAKERWLNKAKELDDLGKSIDESELNLTIQMCWQASELLEKCKLAEIAVRMKLGRGQERFVSEQIAALQQNSGETFHRRVRQYIEDCYVPILDKASEIVESEGKDGDSIIGKARRFLYGTPDIETAVHRRKEELSAQFADGNAPNIVEELGEPKEMLVLLGDMPGSQRVFVLEEDTEGIL